MTDKDLSKARAASSADQLKRVVALFGIVCLLGVVVTPVVSAILYVGADSAPELRPDLEPAGTRITDPRVAGGADFWAQPADLDLSQVSCTQYASGGRDSQPLRVADTTGGSRTATDDRGAFRYVTTSKDAGRTVRSVSCTGGGLESLTLSESSDAGGDRRGALLLLLAIPVLLVVGIAIRRTGFRVAPSGR